MAANLTGRKILFFRCTIDPSMPPRPQNAFDCTKGDTEAEMTPAGIFCKRLHKGETFEHVIPYANVSTIRLAPEDKSEKKAKE